MSYESSTKDLASLLSDLQLLWDKLDGADVSSSSALVDPKDAEKFCNDLKTILKELEQQFQQHSAVVGLDAPADTRQTYLHLIDCLNRAIETAEDILDKRSVFPQDVQKAHDNVEDSYNAMHAFGEALGFSGGRDKLHMLIVEPNMPSLLSQFRAELFAILTKIDALESYSSRTMLLKDVPRHLRGTIDRSSKSRDDLYAIVGAAESWGRIQPSGDWALVVIARNTLEMVKDTDRGRELEVLLNTLETQSLAGAAGTSFHKDIKQEPLMASDHKHKAASTTVASTHTLGDRKMTVQELRGKVDFGIITIRIDEFEAVLQRFPPEQTVRGRRYYNISRVPLNDAEHYLVAELPDKHQPVPSQRT